MFGWSRLRSPGGYRSQCVRLPMPLWKVVGSTALMRQTGHSACVQMVQCRTYSAVGAVGRAPVLDAALRVVTV